MCPTILQVKIWIKILFFNAYYREATLFNYNIIRDMSMKSKLITLKPLLFIKMVLNGVNGFKIGNGSKISHDCEG